MNNRRKTLPPIDPKTDPKLRPLLEALKEITETGDGVRGDPMDRKLTIRDLVDAGLARLKPGSMTEFGPAEDEAIDNDPPGSTLIPPRPTGFNAIGSFGYIVLSWDIPGDLYLNHAFTNIYRSETDNFANAEMIGRDTGMMYTDHVREVEEEGVGFYYWITFTSTEDREGPANSTSGTYAEVIPDIGFLLDKLSGQVNEEVLTPAFKNRLDGFQETISDLGDRYTLSVTNNGHVSGFTIFNTGQQSDFAVLADRFTIANQFGAERHPFFVVGGNTYIDTALIRNASIQEGQLGPISFGKITDNNGTPVTTVAGKLKGELIEAENLRVAEAAVFYGNVYSNNFRAGIAGWAIYQSGNFELNEGRIRNSVQIGNTTAGDIAQGVGSINNWKRPGSTLIDGNKIFTGDAYVDTLQIKGSAVTIPVASYSAGAVSYNQFDRGWKTLGSVWIDAQGGQIQLLATCLLTTEAAWASGTPGYAYMRVLDGGTVIWEGEVVRTPDGERGSSGEGGNIPSESFEQTVPITVALLRPSAWGNKNYYFQVSVGGAVAAASARHRFISATGMKR